MQPIAEDADDFGRVVGNPEVIGALPAPPENGLGGEQRRSP